MPCYCAKEVPKLQPVWLLSYECYRPDDTHAGSQWSKALQLTHSGKKPFVCDQHAYSSTQAQALKRHKLTHSGVEVGLMHATIAITLPQRLSLLKHTR